jgi:hypothetical protein
MEHNGFLIGNFKVVVPKVRFAIKRKIGRTGGRKIKKAKYIWKNWIGVSKANMNYCEFHKSYFQI